VIRVRDGDDDAVLTMDEFERRARRGEISPHALVSIPALTGDGFVEARLLPMFSAAFDPRRLLFRRHFHLGRLPVVTVVVVVVCIALWWWARDLGGGVVTREALVLLGAKARARIVDEGETWRLWTAGLLHKDAVHLGFNLCALLSVGPVLESVYRRGDYVLLLVSSTLACMVASTLGSPPMTVGASGIVFGCLGCAVVFGLRFVDVLPTRYRVYFGVVVVVYTAVTFWLGLLRASTDNWGHAGGVVCGGVFGATLEPRLLRLTSVTERAVAVARPWVTSVVVVVGVVAIGPLLPRVLLGWRQTSFSAFGVVVEHPSTWTRGPDPLGFLAFDNGVDVLASLACARVADNPTLSSATERFLDGELGSLARAGHIAALTLESGSDDRIGTGRTVPARRTRVRFTASEGPFVADTWVFLRGEIECTVVAASRVDASPRALALLGETVRRLRFVPTDAEVAAEQATTLRPDSTKAWLERALAHQGAGDDVRAREAFLRAHALVSAEPSWGARVAGAQARFELERGGSLDVAKAAAHEAVLRAPADPDAVALLLEILRRRGDVAEREHLRAAGQARFPDDERFTP
jgi:membrane associated rhomboid family serine protease